LALPRCPFRPSGEALQQSGSGLDGCGDARPPIQVAFHRSRVVIQLLQRHLNSQGRVLMPTNRESFE
jgi:hypothetical protein